jgi:hypothetical protein
MKTRQELFTWAIEQMALVHKGTGISTKGLVNEAEKLVEAALATSETREK